MGTVLFLKTIRILTNFLRVCDIRMILVISPQAKKQLSKLPKNIQKKTKKQFYFLNKNHKHPSLKTSKMKGRGVFEARVDIHYRFSFIIENEQIYILTVGRHDKGLGKK